MIARIWRGRVRTEDRAAYVDYIERTGLAEYRQHAGEPRAPGCSPATSATARTEVVTFSFWASRDAIRGFAGDDIERAGLLPRGRPLPALEHGSRRSTHFEVVSASRLNHPAPWRVNEG